MPKLLRKFYSRPTLKVAKDLLGAQLVRILDGERLSGRIVEVEAYMGPTDAASHARFGPASRAAPMFGEPGYAYVYFTYGMHYCVNAVTEAAGSGTAVLLRALEPVQGMEQMRANRLVRRPEGTVGDINLTNGPGKLCQALGINVSLNEVDLCGEEMWIEQGNPMPDSQIATSPRVGIKQGREHQWRFYIADSQYVSAHPRY